MVNYNNISIPQCPNVFMFVLQLHANTIAEVNLMFCLVFEFVSIEDVFFTIDKFMIISQFNVLCPATVEAAGQSHLQEPSSSKATATATAYMSSKWAFSFAPPWPTSSGLRISQCKWRGRFFLCLFLSSFSLWPKFEIFFLPLIFFIFPVNKCVLIHNVNSLILF